MKNHRSRLLGLLLFGLLSLGQAYPFSMAWGMSRQTHLCCCRTEVPRPCGCDHGSSLKKKKFRCHEARDVAGPKFSPSPCGKKTQAAALNFQGETCLPRFAAFRVAQNEARGFEGVPVALPDISSVPESPPPRPSSLS